MKKTVSALIILSMLASAVLLVIPIGALPEGKPISTPSEFYAMQSGGVYYLANDIYITSAYPMAFSGVLDGNGHTVYSSSPRAIFGSVAGGTLRNIKVVASYQSAESRDLAALAMSGYGNFENISATVDFEILPSAARFDHTIGGIVGEIKGASVFKSCSVDGSIRMGVMSEVGSGIETSVGGIVGRVTNAGAVRFTDCVSDADIESGQQQMSVGGIVGITRLDSQVLFDGCVNNGDISATRGRHSGTAGICGIADGTHTPSASVRFVGCSNTGNIRDDGEKMGGSGNNVGGILGRGYGIARADFESCLNAGELRSAVGGWSSVGGIIGGIMTYGFAWSGTHAGLVSISDCANIGKVESGNFNGGIIGGALQFNTDGCMVKVERSANYGDINGEYAGGIIGHCGESGFNGLLVKDCYNSGDIDGSGLSAGIVASVDTEQGGGEYAITVDGGRAIEGCINSGGSPAVSGFSGIISSVEKQTVSVSGCINLFESDQPFYAISGEQSARIRASGNYYTDDAVKHPYGSVMSESIARAKEGRLLETLPADTTEIIKWLLATEDHTAAGYSEGWEAFVAARKSAEDIAYKVCSYSEAEKAEKALLDALEGLRLEDGISNAELLTALDEAQRYLSGKSEYTPESWERFERAYERASFCIYSADIETINAVSSELTLAIRSLKIRATYSELRSVIARYVDYRREEFTSFGWAEFRDAFVKALELQDNENASADEVSAAIARLEKAAEVIRRKEEAFVVINKLKETLEEHPSDDYTVSSYAVFKELLAPIYEAAELNDCSSEEIDGLLLDIDEALEVLVERGDLSAVDRLLAPTGAYKQEDFIPDGWAKLIGVVEKINAAREKESAAELTAREAEKLTSELSAALRGLSYKAEFSQIDALIEESEELNEEDFSASSWSALEREIAAVKELKNDENATKEQSDEAATKLLAAIRALEKEEKPQKSGGCGGAIATNGVLIAMLLGTCVFVAKKKRYSKE